MPARTNSFQRLVRAIQGHLSRASTVTESRFLPDRDTGSPVEVDIVIQDVVGDHEILIGIECTAGRRRATIEWYRQMRDKHRDLPINKTVLLSKSGFTADVHKKAKLDGITLMSLQEAHAFEWQGLLGKLQGGTLADVGFSLRELAVEWPQESAGLPEGITPADLVVHANGREVPLGQFTMIAAVQTGFTKGIMANLGAVLKLGDHAYFSFRLPAGSLTTPTGVPIEGLEVQATLTIHPKMESVTWEPVDFNGRTVATATVPADFLFPGATGESVVTASHDDAAGMKVSLLGPKDQDFHFEVFPSALWPGANEGSQPVSDQREAAAQMANVVAQAVRAAAESGPAQSALFQTPPPKP